uniref:Ribosomal protein L6 n=1 Tax=Cryptomonas sp. CCAC 1634B TaxID=2051848 RepID=A0A679CBC7_9CRYP|nr:ribosomal protein L6 [Cryptomonas sp. CCAC 1634B]
MSRLGKLSVKVPHGISVAHDNGVLSIEGPKGKLLMHVPSTINVAFTGEEISVYPECIPAIPQALHGTYRSLVNSMILGVTVGFHKKLELHGVGYRSHLDGDVLVLNVGYSHPVNIKAPDGVHFLLDGNTTITVTGVCKELVGHVAARIRLVRPPEPYKGKGIRYSGEFVRKKLGKVGKK